MMMQTTDNCEVDSDFVSEYFKRLVNCFFKVLPMKEKNEASLNTYMVSLKLELLGCQDLICALKNDSLYITLLSILQALIDNNENSDFGIPDVRREVFRAISICNKLKSRYSEVTAK